MLLCGLAVLGMLVLIVYELVLRSGLSWHAFGFKFFAGRDWDPVNEQFGAFPFIYGTLVSSFSLYSSRCHWPLGLRYLLRKCDRRSCAGRSLFRGIAGGNSRA